MSRNDLLLLAALVVIAIGVAHSYLGERFVFRRLFALADLPLLRHDRAYTQHILRYAWHLTSVAWWALAAILLLLWLGPADMRRATALIVSLTMLASGVVILATAGRRHPAWPLFLVAGLAAMYGV